jgi:hypothetical protein
MTWTDLSGAFGYGTKLTSAQMQNLRDNVTALANGDSGAPRIQNEAIGSHEISWQRLAAGSAGIVGKAQLQTVGGLYYEVLGADGVWYRTCPDFSSDGGGA